MSRLLEGKIALITGAASGIGRATSIELAEQGAKLILADVDDRGGDETARLVPDAVYVHADVTYPEQVQKLVDAAVERFGRLDCAVNNAGISGPAADLADYDLEAWHQVIAVNLTAVFLCMKSELRQMLAQGGGAIVNTASVVGVIGYTRLGAYIASKHGVIGLTRTAALEYANRGIRVNAVCPGWTETPMVMDEGPAPGSDPDVYAALAGLAPLKRLGRPIEIARAIAWLCSDAASFVTGHPLVVDGGVAAGRERAEQLPLGDEPAAPRRSA